jgi:DNA modification methylase
VTDLGTFQPNSYMVGDCRELLRQLPDECIDCVVTSPPYWGLRSYLPDGHQSKASELGTERTYQEYVANMVEVFRNVRRVLKPKGTLWINLGDSYNAYNGNAGPGSSFSRGSACDTERPHLPSGYGLRSKDLKNKDLVGIPWRVAFALQADGWYLRSEIIWQKPNPKPESVTDRPSTSHEELFLLSKSDRYFYDASAIAEDDAAGGKRNRRSVWTIQTEPTPEAHFATMPTKLVQPCILAGCPAGGIALDPFGGSGTVARVAEDNGRQWLLFDLSPGYAEIAKRRTAQTGLLGRCAK